MKLKYIIISFFLLTKLALCSVSPSVVHGAQLFQQYCAACHSVKYLQSAEGIPAFPEKEVPAVLGVHPPDLSLEVNIHGAHWVLGYLNGFYPDPSRPMGTNNKVYPDTAMPNMLAGLQVQMTPKEFQASLNDIVAFLDYASDPYQSERKALGYWVIGFLVILALILFFLFRIIRASKTHEY